MKVYIVSPSGKMMEVVPEKGKLTTVKHINGSKFQFVDDAPINTPKVIKTKKIGNNLELFLSDGDVADVVIENYFIDPQVMPTIFNESMGLTTEAGTITLDSTLNPLFATAGTTLSAGAIAGIVMGVGGVALASGGGSSSGNAVSSDTTPPALDKDTDVASAGTPTDGIELTITLPQNAVAGDIITSVLKDSLGNTVETLTHTVTQQDITAGEVVQTFDPVGFGTYTTSTSMRDAAGNVSEVAEFEYDNNLTGQLQDDYIANAFVFIDSNGDGIWSDDEPWTQTDEQGRFSFDVDPKGAAIIAMGGVDTASGNPNTIVYKTYTNATEQIVGEDIVISPLTTLISAIIDSQRTEENANSPVTEEMITDAVSMLGAVLGVDISDAQAVLEFDFVEAASNPDASEFDKTFLALNRQIGVALGTLGALIDGAAATTNTDVDANLIGLGTAAVTEALGNLIVQKLESGESLDFTSGDDIQAILEESMDVANSLGYTEDLRASNPSDIEQISDVIASFNAQIEEQTVLDPQGEDTLNTLRAVTEVLVPALGESGTQAADERGGDISLSDSLIGLVDAIDTAGGVTDFIDDSVENVNNTVEPFIVNDINGIATKLSKVVIQMPTLGVGDSIDTLYISSFAQGDEDKENLNLELITINPLTKEETSLADALIEEGPYTGYYAVNANLAGYLYIKTQSSVTTILDVKAENTINDVTTVYDGEINLVMVAAAVVPEITITAVIDDEGFVVTNEFIENSATDDAALTFTGTLSVALPVGYTLRAYSQDFEIEEDITINDDLTWSYDAAVLGNGAQAISFAVVDADGKFLKATNPFDFTLDTVIDAPAINPTDGKTINGTAEAGATVTIKNGATTVGTAVADSSGKWSLTLATTLPDTTPLTATAQDSAGNTSVPSEQITVAYATPTTLATLVSVMNDTVTIKSGTFTNDTTPTFNGTLSAALIGTEVLDVFNNDIKIGTATVSGTQWSFTPTIVTNGTYNITFKVVNGEKTGASTQPFAFTLDTVLPTQTVDSLHINDDVAGFVGEVEILTNDAKPTFSGLLSGTLSNTENLNVYIGSQKIGVAVVTGEDWTFTPTVALGEGERTLSFVVEDAAGNKSIATSRTIMIDTIAPASAPSIENSEESIAEGDSTTIIATIIAPQDSTLSLKEGAGDSDLFTIDEDGKVRAKAGLDFESKTSYTFTVVAMDEAGNSKEVSKTITVTDVQEADAIVSIVPDALVPYDTPPLGEMVEITFTLKRTNSEGSATVDWEVCGLEASDFENEELPSGTATFEDGETEITVSVSVPASLTQEALREMTLALVGASEGYYIDMENDSADATIVDSSLVEGEGIRFSVTATNNGVIHEGTEGETSQIVYTIKRSGDTTESLTIDYDVTTSGAALISGDDFGDDALPSGSVTFEAGSDTATVTLWVNGDNAVGPDEQFSLLLSALPEGSRVFGITNGTLLNDDAYITVTPQEIEDATSGEVTHSFVITRSGNTTLEHTVSYTISSVGENGTDLFDTEESIELTFEAGETQKVISFTTTGDEVINGYKSFGIELEAGENVTLLNKVAMSTINPNVQDVEIVTNIDRTLEGGLAEFSYTVTRSGDVSEALDVPWSIVSTQENGVSATDFGGTLPSGTIHFAAGATTATVAFSSSTDTTLEGDEGFRLVLDDTSLPEYIRLINPSVSGVIVDDESAVGFNQSSTFSVVEGDNGSSNLVVTVTRVGFTGNESSVDWALSFDNGEEKATLSDLFANQALLGTVTFKPGEASAVITIKINGDTSYENGLDESFTLTLSNPSSGTKLIGGTGESGVEFDGYSNATTATIINDDSLISVSAPTFSEVEGQGGSSKYMEITIKREGSTVGQDWVKWSLVSEGDGAANNEDLGEANDAISVFDSYENSWIDIASLTGNNAADGSISLAKDGYIMVSYNRDWSYGEDNLPFDQFLLNHLSVEGGTLSALGSLVNQNGLISSLAENSIDQNDENQYALYTADNPGGLELPGIEEGGNRVIISADKSLGDWYFTVSGYVNGEFISETIRGPIDGSVSTSNYFTNVMSITREPAHVAIGLVSSNGKDGYDATAIDSEVELPYGSGLIEGIGDWQYNLQEGIVGAENIGSSRVVIKSEADLSDTTFVIHGGISVGYVQNGYYEMGPTFENITENGQQDNTVTFDTPTHINVEAVSMTGIMDEFYNAMSNGEFPFNATTNYFLVSGLDADGEAYEEVVAAKDILEVDFEDFSLSSGVQIDSLSSNENLLETTLLPQEGENAGRVALGFVMNGGYLSEATFTIIGKDAQGNDITDVIHGPSSPEEGSTYDSSTVLSNKYFASVSSIVSDNDAGEISLIIGLTKPVQTTGEFSVVYGIKACDADGEPLDDFEGMKLLSEGAGRFEFTAPITIELQGANNGVAISEQGLSYVDYIEVVKTADDATIQIGYYSEEGSSSENMLISNDNNGLSGNVFFTYCCGDNHNYETGNPATFPYENTAYAIFKLDVTGESATVNFDVEQLGRYGIDTGKLSYAPEGTFSKSNDDMVYENEGANLLIPALKSPLALTTLDLSAFIDEDNYAIDSVSSFYIDWIDEDNLYLNVGTSENPNWVYFWDLESSYIDVQDIEDGKLAYSGSTIEMYIYAYDVEEQELGSAEIFTGIYTTLSIDAFSGDFDIDAVQYVYFDWIGGENFYINTSETDTPEWVNVFDYDDGYVGIQDIVNGKVAYLGSSSDFRAYVYDANENELSYIENVQYHILSVKELATDNSEGEYYTGYDIGADEIRIRNVYNGELYYNMGTSSESEWIEYWDYVANYNNESEYFPIQDAIDGKFAYVGESVSLRTRFYTNGDYESSIYPYIEASGGDVPSEIATQTGEVALDGSGYIWLRYANDEDSGSDGADMAWINNLHIVDPNGNATIEVVGQKVIKDGVAHEQELSANSGTLKLDGIAIKNTPIVDENGDNLIAITTLKNGTMGTRSDTGIYVTDMNDQENEFSINASGLATSTARSGMSTLTTLGVNEAKSVIYDQADGSDTMADRTISLVHGNLSSLASNAEVIDPNALHVISLETLVNRFVDSEFLDYYEATSDDIALVYFENWSTDDNCDLYYNQGTIEEPNWVSFNGGDIQADDIRDGKLAFTGSYLEIGYPEFSLDADWEDYYYYDDYDNIGFPEHVVTLEDLARAFSTSSNQISSIYIDGWSVDDDLYYNQGTAENPAWVYFGDYRDDYYDNHEGQYPLLTQQDILDGKLAYSGNYVSFYGDVYAAEGYAQTIYGNDIHGYESSYIDANMHTLTLGDLAKAFGIAAGDIDYVELYDAYADESAYVNIGTINAPEWISLEYFTDEYGELSAQDILDGKVIYGGDYFTIQEIYIYDKDENYLVDFFENGSIEINNSRHIITLEDIASMYGNNFSANDIDSVYVNNWYVDDDLWYNYGTEQNPEWGYYYDEYPYPTMSAQDIADGKFAYSGDYVQLATYIYDQDENYLVYDNWSDSLYPAQPNPYKLDTIEVYQASDGSIIDDEPSFMHAIVSKYGIDSDDSVYILDDTLTMDGNSRLTFTSHDDLSDRTIIIEGYVEGNEELVTETIEVGPNGSTVVATNRFIRVESIEVSEGANDVEISVGSSIVYDTTMTLFAKSVDADTDGSICITGLDGLGNVQTITYENILDGLSKSMGEFKEIFAITTEGISSGSIEFSAVEGDGFIDVALNGTRDEEGYIALATPQRISISNNGGSGSENQEFRIVGLDEEGNTVTELVSGIMNGGAYVSTHYFSKILTVEAGLVDGVTSATISVGTISAPVTPEQAMSVYGGEVIVNDSMALFETPSQITFSSEDNLTSRVFTITGTDAHGATIVENVIGANGGIAISSHKFMSVSSISVDEGAVGSVKVGYTTSGGMTDNFVITGSGTAEDPFVGYSTNTTEGTESDVLLFVNFNGSAPGSVKLSYDLAVQGATNSDTLYVEYSSTINSLLQGKVYFEDGESETTILIPVAGDDTKEGDEGMSLTLVSGSTGTTIDAEHNTTDITISNDDDIVTLDATAKTVVEGNDDAHRHKISFTITREDDVTDKEVFWSIGSIGGDGQADEGDFEAISGSVTFAMGSKTATIDVYVSADRIYEGVETFTLVLDTPPVGSGYSLNNAVANGTITEDDVGVSIEATDTSKNETDGSVTHTFTVTRVGDTTQASSINWAVSGTLGTSDIDAYVSDFGEVYPSGNVNFAANETTKTITVTTDGDNQMTGDRAFDVTLSNATDDTSDIYHTVAVGSIIEDDAVSLTIDQARHLENTGSEKTVTYTLTRTDGSHAATYNWKVLLQGDGVNAIASMDDFSASQDALEANGGLPSGTVTFEEGSTTATVTLKIANDDLLEADEAFKLHFEGANASVAAAQDITSYIINDIVGYGVEVKVGDAVVNTSISEGDSTNKTISVTFMRTGDSSQAATLAYSIEGATANAIVVDDFVGMDELPSDVEITFEAWQSTVTRTFTLKADSMKEENESFKIILKNGAAELASKTIEVTNDDAGLVLEASSGSLAEGTHLTNAAIEATYTPLTYTVFRSGDMSHSSTVNWRVKTSDGITIDDFVGATDALGTNAGLPSGTITFAADDVETFKTFTLNIKKDSKYEGISESLVVELYDASAGTGIETATATTTITDDDKEVGFASYSVDGGAVVNNIHAVVTEGDPTPITMVTDEWVVLTYKVVRSGNDRDGSQTVTWNLAGEAYEGADATTPDWNEWNGWTYVWKSGDVVGFDSEGNKATSGTLVFENNTDNEKYITVKVHKDHYQENPEAFKITLTSNTEGLSVSETTGVATGTITDDDIALVLASESATRVVHTEGQLDAQGNTVYTEFKWVIEREGVAEAVDLAWSIQGYGGIHDVYYSDRYSSDGFGWHDGWIPAATADTTDFVAGYLGGTVHFNDNETSKTLTIRVVGDAVVESTEAFRVVLSKPANVGDITGLGNYYDGLNPSTSYFEGVIVRDEGRFGIESYELDINSASNFDNDDYDLIDNIEDAKTESNSGYVSHFFKIYRDFTDAGEATIQWKVEGSIGSGVWDVDPFLYHDTSVAANSDDFEVGQNALNQENGLPSGIAVIPDGEMYTIIEIRTKGDISAEDLNSYNIWLSNPSAGSTLDAYHANAYGYIANDDHPLFSIGQIVPTEGEPATYGSKIVVEGDTVTYTVYRSGSSAYEASVDWSVIFPDPIGGESTTDTNSQSNYTAATSDFDTAGLSGTLVFAAGQNAQTITLAVKNDGVKESWAEAFSIKLSNAQWGASVPQNIKDAQTPAISEVSGEMESIIVDNSGATSVVSVSAVNNATNGFEGGYGGSHTITYTLTRSGDVTEAAQIGWTVRTPSSYDDYVAISGDTVAQTYTPYQASKPSYAVGLVSFGAGESSKTVTLEYMADAVIENNESFVFTLIDGKTVLEDGYAEWMAPWYYGTGNDGTANANKSGLYFLNGSGRIPDSDNLYRDETNYTVSTEVKNDDGKIYVNNVITTQFNSTIGANIYEGDTGHTTFRADISRYGRIDHDVTVDYVLVDSNNAVVTSGTWTLAGDATNTTGNGSKSYTMNFDLGAANSTPEANRTYTLRLSNASDANILFNQNTATSGGDTTRDIPVTVLNDDTTWSVAATTLSQAESDDSATQWTFTISRPNGANDYAGEAVVTYKIVSNNQTYTITSDDIVYGTGERTVNFAAGQYSQVVIFNVSGDRIAERNESFNVELVSANHGVIHETNNTITYTIVNDDTTVEIVNATPVLEGDVDGAYLEFDVVRKGQIGNGSSEVEWTVQDGTATKVDDLTEASDKTGTLSFDAGVSNISTAIDDGYGEQTQTVRVYIKGDTTVELDQSLSVSLSGSTESDGIATGKGIASGTILNDESVFTLTADVSVNEGDATGQKFTITRSHLTGQSQTIDYVVTTDGSSHAVSADDMFGGVLASGSVTFAPNELTKEIFIKSSTDAVAELDEVFKLSISVANGTTGATIDGDAYAYGVVLNDDAGTPTVASNDSTITIVADAFAVEGDSGTQYVAFTLIRGGTLSYDASVDWHIEVNGKTAVAADFGGTLPSGTLTMPNGQTSFTINVPISGDSAYEGDETFTLVLENPEPGLEISVGTAVGTITNDDTRISIVENVVVDENASTATFTLSRTEPYTEQSSVTWTLTPSANVLGSGDISDSLTGTAVFAENESTTTVVVYLNDDAISEGDEIFNLTLSNPTAGADLDPENLTKTLTITNNDQDVITYSVDATSKAEGDGDGWTTYTVTISRQNPTTQVSVDWSVVETTEENLSDIVFDASSGTVSFVGTALTTTFDIKVKTDDIGDFDKYFTLNLSNPTTNDSMGAYVDTSDTTVQVDNDDPAFSVALTSESFVEGSGTTSKLITFVVTRDGDSSGVASVTWTIAADEDSVNPANLSDFGGYWPSGTTVFMDGESSKTIQVAIAPDSTFELSEGFKVVLSELVSQTQGARIIVDTDAGVIVNDDIGVSVSVDESSVVEGNEDDSTDVTFTLSAEGVANKTVTVYFTLEGSGLSPADEVDFSFSNIYNDNDWDYDDETGEGWVVLRTDGDGNAEASVIVTVNGDIIAGANETFRLRVTEVEGGTVADGSEVVTIENDDTAIASIVNTTVDTKEGADGDTTIYTFTLTRSGSTLNEAEVSYVIEGFGDNQAIGADFVDGELPEGTVTFEVGSSTATIEIEVAGDSTFESDEGFIVIVGQDTPNEVRLATEIRNDDSATLLFNGIITTVKEGNDDASPNYLSYEIIRNGDNSEALEVTYTIVEVDENDVEGTITIPAGESRYILNIPVPANTEANEDRNLMVSISAEGFDSPAAIESTILDDDSGVSIEFVGVAPSVEGDSEDTIYTFRINRVGNDLVASNIAWMVAGLGINAVVADDFTTAMNGVVEFEADEAFKEFTIVVNADTLVENNEHFRVSIASETETVRVESVDALIANDDTITANADIIYGGAGVDIIDGLAGDDVIHGGAGADVLFGGAGDDTIYAEGGADVIYAGLGDDTIIVESVDFMLIDGGLGFDTLTFENENGLTLDFASFEGEIKSIEAIDISGFGEDSLDNLTYDAVFAINENHALYIKCDADDTIDVSAFTAQNTTVTHNNVTYDVYRTGEEDFVNLYIHQIIG